jgi:hypothetical protein
MRLNMHWHAFHHLSIRGTETLGIGIITRSVMFLQRYFAAAKRSVGPTNSTWRKFVQPLREMNFDNTQSGYATSTVSTERSPAKCAQKSSKEPRHRAHWRGSETEGRSVTSLTTNENKIPRSTVALVSGSFPSAGPGTPPILWSTAPPAGAGAAAPAADASTVLAGSRALG